MRLLLITHPDIAYSEKRYDRDLVAGLAAIEDVVIGDWDQMTAASAREAARVAEADLDSFDVCVVYVRFQQRVHAEPWDWSGFHGLRVWMEHDAWANYSDAHVSWHGTYPAAYRRDRFHMMISTGRRTCELLRLDGVNACWMPKGYSQRNFMPLDLDRSGICTFGTMWPSRRAMIARLQRRGIDIVDVSGPFATLNHRLNLHDAAVVCNKPGAPPFGKVGRAIHRFVPSFVHTYPAVEPMIKTFEVAAAGCAPVIDYQDELVELGFIDGLTCLTYQTFDEAADKILATDSERLQQIGSAAAALAQERHTWRHRAERVVQLLQEAEIR